MKWWLIVYILTTNGWEPGEQFDGWWALEQASFEACEKHRDFANEANLDTSLVDKICFACEQRFEDGTAVDETCTGPCVPCKGDTDDLMTEKNHNDQNPPG